MHYYLQITVTGTERVALALVEVVVNALLVPFLYDMRKIGVFVALVENTNILANSGIGVVGSVGAVAIIIVANNTTICIILCNTSKVVVPKLQEKNDPCTSLTTHILYRYYITMLYTLKKVHLLESIPNLGKTIPVPAQVYLLTCKR